MFLYLGKTNIQAGGRAPIPRKQTNTVYVFLYLKKQISSPAGHATIPGKQTNTVHVFLYLKKQISSPSGTCYHTWKTNEHGPCVLIPCKTNIQNAPNLIQADRYYTVKVDLARIQKKGVRALRGYLCPPMKSKNKSSSSQVSSS